jgi:hypothetical protein
MAITLDSNTGGAQSATFQTDVKYSHIIGSGTNRLLVACFSYWQGSANFVGITYGGVALQAITGFIGTFAPKHYVYMLKNPTVGTATLSAWSDAAMESATLASFSFFGVDQTTPR